MSMMYAQSVRCVHSSRDCWNEVKIENGPQCRAIILYIIKLHNLHWAVHPLATPDTAVGWET